MNHALFNRDLNLKAPSNSDDLQGRMEYRNISPMLIVERLRAQISELKTENKQLRAAGRTLLLAGSFTHTDQNITKSCCNACGEWAWDDRDEREIQHSPRCRFAAARAVIEAHDAENTESQEKGAENDA